MSDINWCVSPRVFTGGPWGMNPNTHGVTGSFPGGTTTAIETTPTGPSNIIKVQCSDPMLDGPVTYPEGEWTVSADVLTTWTGEVGVGITDWSDGGFGGIFGLHAVTEGVWQRITWTGTWNRVGQWLAPYFDAYSGYGVTSGDTLTVTNVMLNYGSTALPFFDGNTAADEEYIYAWTGTENLSRSVRVTLDELLAVTPQTGTSSVLLQVFPEAVGGTVTSILRNDANGTAPVRTLDGYLPTDSNVILVDYEPALVGPITYTVTIDGTDYTATTSLAGNTKPWLFVPIYPQLSVQVPLVTGYDATRASQSTIHEIVGRQDPLVTIGRLAKRRGRLSVFCPDHATAMGVVEVYSLGQVVMLRQATHSGMDMYHVATDVAVSPLTVDGGGSRWQVSVSFVEVQRPTGPLLGALGWTFDDVATGYASFNTLVAEFETFDDLTLGPGE